MSRGAPFPFRLKLTHYRSGTDDVMMPATAFIFHRPSSVVSPELPPVDSNHHSRLQRPLSCRWTRGH
jgi:hypothetical protein